VPGVSSTTTGRMTSRRARQRVAPHPHMGLQTRQLAARGEDAAPRQPRQSADGPAVRAGLMTSGRAITHSEESPQRARADPARGPALVALPDGTGTPRAFEHHAELPVVNAPGLTAP